MGSVILPHKIVLQWGASVAGKRRYYGFFCNLDVYCHISGQYGRADCCSLAYDLSTWVVLFLNVRQKGGLFWLLGRVMHICVMRVSRVLLPLCLCFALYPVVGSADPAPDDAAKGGSDTPVSVSFLTDLRPPVRPENLPRTRWEHMEGHSVWTRAALSALKDHGKPLVELVPRDIEAWCPAYSEASDADRRAFWVGFLSALAKHESTYKPWAVGGGGKWYGLLQILPSTARGYKCRVGTGAELKNCLLYTSPSPRDRQKSRMPSSA